MGINPTHLRVSVVRPTLESLGLWSVEAEALVMETLAVESAMGAHLLQLSGGPALGIAQVEPATFKWLLKFVRKHPTLYLKFKLLFGWPAAGDMIWNLRLAVAMCRLRYLPDGQRIPSSRAGRAQYWKRIYNTKAGAGTPERYLTAWTIHGDGDGS